jgi:hypothetical protein
MSCSTCGGAFPAQAVDTHIFRVGNRAGIAPGKDVDAVERAIEDNVPAEFQRHAHHWLILHGRYTCVARKPKCPACLIRDLCAYEDKTPEASPRGQNPRRGLRMSDHYDVVGIGNAIVDVISHGDDSFLENMGITKGIMQLVERERAELLYAAMSDRVQTAGGSVANTIAGVGSLGLSTAFLGKVKDDALGRFYAKPAWPSRGPIFPNPPGVGRPAAHLAVDDLRLTRWRTVDEHLSRRRRGFRRG